MWISWISSTSRRGGLKGEMGVGGEQGLSDPFRLLAYIAQNVYYFVYVHPSRFQSIVRTRKDNYRISDLVDFTGKLIHTATLDLSKDNQQQFCLTFGKNIGFGVVVTFNILIANNKAFAIFQVCEVSSPSVDQFFLPVYISTDRGNVLHFQINCELSRIGKLTGCNVSFDNTAAEPKLTLALGKSVSHTQQIAGQKYAYVLSLSRNSGGVFAINLNSVLVFSHTDNRPFHCINGNEDAEYHLEGLIWPIVPPSSFTVIYTFPKAFPKT